VTATWKNLSAQTVTWRNLSAQTVTWDGVEPGGGAGGGTGEVAIWTDADGTFAYWTDATGDEAIWHDGQVLDPGESPSGEAGTVALWACFGPLGYVPLGSDVDPTPDGLVPVGGLLYDSASITCFLLEIDADTYEVDLTPIAAGHNAPPGSTSLGGTVSARSVILTRQVLRWATHGLILEDLIDADADPHLDARLQPVDVSRKLEIGDQGFFRLVSRASLGELRLRNGDGGLDTLSQDYILETRALRLKTRKLTQRPDGRFLGPFNLTEFDIVFTGTVGRVRTEQRDLIIEVGDLLSRLSKTVPRERYAEREDGEEQVDAVFKPIGLGDVFNAPVVMEDPIRLIGCLHAGPVFSIRRLKDAGVKLVDTNIDVGTRAELEALVSEGDPTREAELRFDIPLGSFATCLSEGLVRYGRQPTGVLTADFLGGGGMEDGEEAWSDGTFWDDGKGWIERSSTAGQGTYVGDIVGIARKLLDDYADDEISAAIDDSVWEQIREDVTAEGSIYLQPNQDYIFLDLIETLLAGVNVCLLTDRSGKLTLRRLRVFGTTRYDLLLDDSNTRPASLKRLPLTYQFPFDTWRGSYAQNERPMSDQEIATSVTGAFRASLRTPFKLVDAVDPVTRQIYFDRGPATIRTTHTSRGRCLTRLEERLQLYSREREMYEVEMLGTTYSLDLLRVVRVVSPRYDLSDGKNFAVVGIEEERSARSTRLTLWG
jgi:hypothetical protein